MSTAAFHISSLLEKMTSSDKDFRFMATSDLMSELQKDSIQLDEDSERKVVKMLLRLLEDKNGEVQNLAVKCLGPLVGKVKEYQVETIVDALCANMRSDKEQLRDIAGIGLKTVLSELPPAATGSGLATNVCRKITGQLTSAIAQQEDVAVQLEALDILSDMLSRLGAPLGAFHASLLHCLLPQLSSPRLAVRKRAVGALGHLAAACSTDLFVELADHLLDRLPGPRAPASPAAIRTLIQCLGSVGRQAGHRLGAHLDRLMPLVEEFCNLDDDELRESCLQAFEAFLRKCPKEMGPHVPNVTSLCLQYMKHDPNYNYDSDEDEEQMETEDNEFSEQESEDEYSDDDDMSWKVRRAAAKCMAALIGSRPDLLSDFHCTLAPALIHRFKEREENVKADVFGAYIVLLRQTRPPKGWLEAMEEPTQTGSNLHMLRGQVPLVIKALQRQLKDRSVRARQGCFSLLTELAGVLPGSLAEHMPVLVAGIVFSLADRSSSSTIRMDALAFLQGLLSTEPAEAFHSHLPTLLPPVMACVADPFYKIAAEALLVLQELVRALWPLDRPRTLDPEPYVGEMSAATLARLRATDLDQEVKERAIACMGHLVAHLGDRLGDDLQPSLLLLLDRLRNEITRLPAVKALTLVASSPLRLDLQPIVAEALPILASFLRKNQRALRLATLAALDALTQSQGLSLPPCAVQAVLAELPALVSENDMHVAQLAVDFLATVTQAQPASLAKVSGPVLSELLRLLRSPLLPASVLAAAEGFLQALVGTRPPCVDYEELISMLTAPVYEQAADGGPGLHKQVFHSLARCVAALAAACPQEAAGTANRLVCDARSPHSSTGVKVLAFLSLAEVGQVAGPGPQRELKAVLLEALGSPSEDVRAAASYALGRVGAGNLPDFLPFLLGQIEAEPRRQYLLLHSLREALGAAQPDSLKPYAEDIWALLFQRCEGAEEGTRGVVAECIGKLVLVNPPFLLPRFRKQLAAGRPHTRSTVITAVKFLISDQPHPIDPLLKSFIGEFMESLQDPDLNVRRATLAFFNSAVHNKPSLVRDLLDDILPLLYQETKIRRDLIREVEMGPFKHTVDDGLDVRKAAFECMYSLLESCLGRLDICEFLNHVEDGLKDHYDIRMLTFIMLARLATLCPAPVLQRVDRLIEPLRATCTAKVKAGSVKQEFEKQDELKRSAMRAVAALLTIPEVGKSPIMADFSSQIRSNPELAALFESIQKDSASAPSTDSMELS
ncbi:cullin-associated NEDD8-dissociated protein 2 [Lynx canadensis]|uniref:TATA-binding protein interacting (TIP20) domain-containing protein n=2 Tax=Felis catus TaxID=9685 RepID=M3W9E7_FELCA|nr:cullin-associated NEDD8-dissociated protein 2 [Lynx canadensis]XP_044907909.1 cullin-associated NEDD8-dissociated protein 2 isoform X1 [Felis catus]XP_046953084.1 cullin-associated NEDD8-dissociated protein 2 [Lynx rufus]